jgi:ABC-type sugar transport system ATPase subunit
MSAIAGTSKTSTPLLKIEGLTKQFPGVMALHNVDLSINHSEIHDCWAKTGRESPRL